MLSLIINQLITFNDIKRLDHAISLHNKALSALNVDKSPDVKVMNIVEEAWS